MSEHTISWMGTAGKVIEEPICDVALPYVEAIGVDLAVQFLLRFGGTPVYIPAKSFRSEVMTIVGREGLLGMFLEMGGGHVRVPVARIFLARYYRSKGMSVLRIARLLRVDATSVRKMLQTNRRRAEDRSLIEAVRTTKLLRKAKIKESTMPARPTTQVVGR